MFEVQKTDEFDEWLSGLKDQKAKATIASRVERLGRGNAGDVRPVGAGISEMRIPLGPGYRVYFKQTGVLLSGARRKWLASFEERSW
jgi:putative addiction module killer protein